MYKWLNANSRQFLAKDYLENGQSPEQRIEIVFNTAEKILNKKGYASKAMDYFSRGWFSLSTPIWVNFGNDRGLPISCFGSYIEDDSASICYTQSEISMMSKHGGGTAAKFNLRGRGFPIKGGRNGKTGGAVHFMQCFNTNINVFSQGATRRGSFAAYLDIDHPDIMEFLTIKSEASIIHDISFGVCIRDYWLKEMVDGDKQKRKVWAKVLECRNNHGYPYLIFLDNVNRNTVDVYKDLKMWISHSNLCTEIFLPTNLLESFVCDLLSLNLLYYDEWKDTDLYYIVVCLLDAVMTEFINKAKNFPFMTRAVRFAERHRALGVGRLGWHSLLQSKMIPFESMEAKLLNTEIAKTMKAGLWAASAEMAKEYGEPVLLKGYGRRHTTLTADAPTTSSAFILEQASPSNEPFTSNYSVDDLAKGKFSFKNPKLEALLEKKDKNTTEVWMSILKNNGSVQHLDFLNKQEKDVFKTFIEISPMEIIVQASQRQKYIDQGQSINLMLDPNVSVKDKNTLTLKAWELGLNSLYYQKNVNAAQQLTNSILSCTSCEG